MDWSRQLWLFPANGVIFKVLPCLSHLPTETISCSVQKASSSQPFRVGMTLHARFTSIPMRNSGTGSCEKIGFANFASDLKCIPTSQTSFIGDSEQKFTRLNSRQI